MANSSKRREFLVSVGAAGVASFAGCIGGDTSNGNESSSGTNNSGSSAENENNTESNSSAGGDGNQSGGGGSNSGRAIKVGVLQPTTGGFASIGEPLQQAALLPAVQLEDANINFTIDTQTEDTQSDPQAGISAAQALVDAGYPAITGAASSETTIQVAQNVTVPNKTVLTSPASTSPEMTKLEDNGYLYRTIPSDALQGRVLAQVANQRIEASTVSAMYVNNSYGQALGDSFVQAFGENNVPAQVSFEKAQSSYTSKLQEVMAPKPDAVMIVAYPESANQLLRDFYSNYSRDTPILVTGSLRDSELPGNVGQSLTNLIGSTPLPAGPAQEFFNNSFKEEYGSEPGVYTANAYDATAIQILANAASGKNSGPAVQENIDTVTNPDGTEVGPKNLAEAIEMATSGEEINYQGASGALTFDENGDVTAATYELFTYTENGESKQVDTIEIDSQSSGSSNGNSTGGGNSSS